jgi:hypothetical protein
MITRTITDPRELTSDGIYKTCRIMLDSEKMKHAESLIANEYTWIISHDVLCILYGELNADKKHRIMGIPVRVNKGRTRSIILRRTNENKCGTIGLSNKELSYLKNDVDLTKKLCNSLYGISNIKPKIKKVIFNDPATIIFWNDGTKTVVKADGESFDPEKGMAMAISKKMLGNEGRYYKTFKKWLPKEDSTEYVNLPIFSKEEIKTIPKGCSEGLHPGAIKMADTLRTAFPRTKGGNHNE